MEKIAHALLTAEEEETARSAYLSITAGISKPTASFL